MRDLRTNAPADTGRAPADGIRLDRTRRENSSHSDEGAAVAPPPVPSPSKQSPANPALPDDTVRSRMWIGRALRAPANRETGRWKPPLCPARAASCVRAVACSREKTAICSPMSSRTSAPLAVSEMERASESIGCRSAAAATRASISGGPLRVRILAMVEIMARVH